MTNRYCEGFETPHIACSLPAIHKIDFIPLDVNGKENYLFTCLRHTTEWINIQPVVVDGERYRVLIHELEGVSASAR